MGQPDTASSHSESTPPTDAATEITLGGVLVVEPVIEVRLQAASTLAAAGFHVTTAQSFSQAKALLRSRDPALVMTAVRLGDYNGLHLVLRAKAINPHIAAVVTSRAADAVLRSDAEAMGATFVVTPVSSGDFVAATLRTIFRGDTPSAAIRPPFERRQQQRRTTGEAFVPDRRRGDRRRTLPCLVSAATTR
jgi:DNA-binding NtrC family response regulator